MRINVLSFHYWHNLEGINCGCIHSCNRELKLELPTTWRVRAPFCIANETHGDLQTILHGKRNLWCLSNSLQRTMNISNSFNLIETSIHWSKILLGVFLYLIVLVTILGNILVLMAVKNHKRLQTVFNIYVVNLALTDVLVAVTAVSFYTLDNILGYWPFGRIMCGVWIFFDYGMTFVSVFTLCIISIDRFWAVSWPVHYKSHHNKKKALGMITGVW